MRWQKLGLVFAADGRTPWMTSHASLPVPLQLENGNTRVFFSTRTTDNRSSIAWVDIDLTGPQPRVYAIADKPILGPGNPGSFDDSGASIGCVVADGQAHRIYYMGWNLGVLAPWRNSIGLAIGQSDGLSFQRYSDGPIIDRSPEDPFTVSYPWVLRTASNEWRMWYGSNLTWGRDRADMSHVVKHCTSTDGIRWVRNGSTSIGFYHPGEYAIARPCVLRDSQLFRAWFAWRGDSYQLGYAESHDGVHWTRRDELVGISPSDSGWDSEMICYPAVFDAHGTRWMFYNGNGYGRTGFGLARLEQD